MKLRIVVPFLFLALAFSVPAFALEGETQYETDPIIVYASDIPDSDYSFEVLSRSPITPAQTTGLKSIMLTLLGNYDVIVGEYTYQNSNGTVQYLREMQPDYVWLVSAAIFAIVLYCVFRLGGAALCRL